MGGLWGPYRKNGGMREKEILALIYFKLFEFWCLFLSLENDLGFKDMVFSFAIVKKLIKLDKLLRGKCYTFWVVSKLENSIIYR